ncbi:hypothetical protein ACJMK2_015513 [Sinanodonta woodiana]|uniref:Uncharacterized protein n=1 Tax=Sinanodonta woodiana TaxID=1069815 RepID=A0ABD3UQL7_SINWO
MRLMLVSILPTDVSFHIWTATQDTEVTCTYNIDAYFKSHKKSKKLFFYNL